MRQTLPVAMPLLSMREARYTPCQVNKKLMQVTDSGDNRSGATKVAP